MKIRKATRNDVSSILGLIKELADFEKAPNEVIVTEETLLKDGFSEQPLYYTIVGEVDNQIVGMALYFYKYSTWKGKVMHLEDLIVKQSERGKGYGRILLNEIIAIAKEEDLKRIDWQVLDWNEPAVKFYESIGAEIQKEWWNCRLDKGNLENYSVN